MIHYYVTNLGVASSVRLMTNIQFFRGWFCIRIYTSLFIACITPAKISQNASYHALYILFLYFMFCALCYMYIMYCVVITSIINNFQKFAGWKLLFQLARRNQKKTKSSKCIMLKPDEEEEDEKRNFISCYSANCQRTIKKTNPL